MKNLLPRFLVHLQVKATSLKSLQYGHMMSGKFVTSSTTADGATSQRGRSAQHDRLQRSVLRSRGPPPHPRRQAASLRHVGGAPSCSGGPPAAGRAAGRVPAADLLRAGEWEADLLQRPGEGAPARCHISKGRKSRKNPEIEKWP